MIDTTISEFTGLSYNLDHNFIAFNNLPSYYRYIETYRILQSMSGASQLFWDNSFLPKRDTLLQDIHITSQTIVLEAYLNEKFDFTNRNITIINSQTLLESHFIYNDGEIGDVEEPFTYIYNEGEIPVDDERNTYLYNLEEVILNHDFEVRVPQSVIDSGFTQDQIKVVIDKYKSLGTIYVVTII